MRGQVRLLPSLPKFYMEIGSFKISGHSTKRNWAVYLFVATPINKKQKKLLYVGKVGDNRAGCNPVISRVGNHFSYNKIHSQIRNAIPETENYNYEYYYCQFEKYEIEKDLRDSRREKINELERELNRIVQKRMDDKLYKMINPYQGNYVSKEEKNRRTQLITDQERNILEKLTTQALRTTTINRK